ncbi:MAG: FKBP-type peptidyl-prolyl cis-trans isomerase [Ekhidna sp.]
MRKGFLTILVGFILLSCGDGNVKILVDPDIQLAIDSTEIAEYMEARGYTDFETTDLGVRYIILNEGTGTDIDESDIVTFDYNGMLTNDSIFDTSIKAVGDSIRNVENIPDKFTSTFTSTKAYSPFTITYTSSGWTVNGQFVPGFSDGISTTLNKMNVGGHALVIMPSALGYGTASRGLLIPENSVLIFEFFPTEVTKQ